MTRRQFNIRHMIVAMTVVATFIVAYPWLAQNAPVALVFAAIASAVIGMFGFFVVAFAGFIALTIYASDEQADMRENLWRCVSLAGIGFAMCLPTVLVFVIIAILART